MPRSWADPKTGLVYILMIQRAGLPQMPTTPLCERHSNRLPRISSPVKDFWCVDFVVNPDADRFGGVGRHMAQRDWLRLAKARVCVVGVGGVGSWVVEALARSGVGALTLVDLDEVCITNVNRQLPALDGGFGNFQG